ncbi:MAG: hypothetical protein EWV54_21980 [Microcystis novacekii Mn_MB_F_20050700_S1D]|uniref:Uncharacterized protein n=1 Tax=Microcystis novacekii Mn_MB_F_20050700_S1D TaxID=2486266 RepID=A0A552IFK1_9CHRO|nr:MAG: hypothetical protein EWV54_21980 [Microcystis novacekii Mn_MB_F_20050700_S1D]
MNYEEMSNEDLKSANDNLVAVIEKLLSNNLVPAKDCQTKCCDEYNQCIKDGKGVLVYSANLRGCITGCP